MEMAIFKVFFNVQPLSKLVGQRDSGQMTMSRPPHSRSTGPPDDPPRWKCLYFKGFLSADPLERPFSNGPPACPGLAKVALNGRPPRREENCFSVALVLQHRFSAWQARVFIEQEAKIRSPEGAQYESLGQRPRTGHNENPSPERAQ
jgi:hypothetical protein